MLKNRYGQGAYEYWIYEPAQPMPKEAPVVIFCHGWGSVNPRVHGAWIKHIVRKGNIVIYPRYQAQREGPPKKITKNAARAIKNALQRLSSEAGHVRPQLDKLAIVGHSVGGIIGANIAALAGSGALPRIKAVMCVEPGNSWPKSDRMSVPLVNMDAIPAGTLLLTVAGDQDAITCDVDAKRIFKESKNVRIEDKDYIVVVSDGHASPPLWANHVFPFSPDLEFDSGETKQQEGVSVPERNSNSSGNGVTVLDYALWRLFDALCQAAFYGENRAFALGNTSEQRDMGYWSDGEKVKELFVSKHP